MHAPGTPQRRRSHEPDHAGVYYSDDDAPHTSIATTGSGPPQAEDKQPTTSERSGACNVAVCGLAFCALFFAVIPSSNIAPASLSHVYIFHWEFEQKQFANIKMAGPRSQLIPQC